MRVLSVGNMYPPHHQGGYELVWRSSVGALRAAGHSVHVLTTDYHAHNGSGPDVEPDVYRELRWYWRDHEFPRLTPAERLRLERHNAACLRRHLDQLQPDAVTWWAMGGMSLSLIGLCWRAGIPSVAFVHDDWPAYAPHVDAWTRAFKRQRPVGRLVELASGIPTRFDPGAVAQWVFVSEQARAAGLAHGWKLRATAIAHSGIDAAFLNPSPPRDWRWRLLYVGRIDRRKGIDAAVDALALLPAEASLTIAGTGDANESERLAEQIRAAGVQQRVELLGFRDRAALVELYAAADAVVFPVRWSEPWGLVPLEAMGIGRPVVASGRGGSAEYLRDGVNCLLCDPDRPETIAAAISRLAAAPELRAELVAAARQTAARHTEEHFNATVVRIVEALTSTAGA
jgi:glycosyltransferase involved in cell wall biosynthesis